MTTSDDQREYYKEIIRGELVRDSKATVTHLQEVLKKAGCDLDRHYIATLKNKVFRERTHYIQTRSKLKGEYVQMVREEMKRMWDIMVNPFEYSHNKIAAAHEMREAFEHLLNIDADVNILKGAFATPDPTYTISEPRLIAAVDALIRFNILPKDAIPTTAITAGSPADNAAPAAPQSSG
jgi:Mitochondrial inner membrane protein